MKTGKIMRRKIKKRTSIYSDFPRNRKKVNQLRLLVAFEVSNNKEGFRGVT